MSWMGNVGRVLFGIERRFIGVVGSDGMVGYYFGGRWWYVYFVWDFGEIFCCIGLC